MTIRLHATYHDGYAIKNDDDEYLCYFDRTEYGDSYGFTTEPELALKFETHENAKMVLKWLSKGLRPEIVKVEKTKNGWRIKQGIENNAAMHH